VNEQCIIHCNCLYVGVSHVYSGTSNRVGFEESCGMYRTFWHCALLCNRYRSIRHVASKVKFSLRVLKRPDYLHICSLSCSLQSLTYGTNFILLFSESLNIALLKRREIFTRMEVATNLKRVFLVHSKTVTSKIKY